MSVTVEPMRVEPRPARPVANYLNASYSVSSWLLTKDHKRIAILYLISITFFFFLGGGAAVLFRLELMTPAGDLVQAETYNKLFTLHGIVMIFFFLIPSVPAVLGNFVLPMIHGWLNGTNQPTEVGLHAYARGSGGLGYVVAAVVLNLVLLAAAWGRYAAETSELLAKKSSNP